MKKFVGKIITTTKTENQAIAIEIVSPFGKICQYIKVKYEAMANSMKPSMYMACNSAKKIVRSILFMSLKEPLPVFAHVK